MAKDRSGTTGKAAEPSREERLAAELRANLLKRKDQARARAATDGDEKPEEAASSSKPGKT